MSKNTKYFFSVTIGILIYSALTYYVLLQYLGDVDGLFGLSVLISIPLTTLEMIFIELKKLNEK